jgi:hypothetical protein
LAAQESLSWPHEYEGHMTHDSQYQIQRQQHQKQRQQQQLQQDLRPYFTPGAELPEKQHQSKHNPVSEALHSISLGGDQ